MIKGKHTTLDDMTRAIDAVTFKQMERVAQELLDEKTMAITGLGPLSTRQLQLAR